MSAPQTNLETEKRRHRGPIIGMIAVVTFALTLLFFLMLGTSDEGQPVDSGEGTIDGRTGEPVAEPPADPTAADPGTAPLTTPPAQPAAPTQP